MKAVHSASNGHGESPRFIRPAAQAGRFYPADPGTLRRAVERHLEASGPAVEPAPKALIAPHAGYIYSGATAGAAYATIAQAHGRIQRVVLIGPAHYVEVTGLAASGARAFATPLGDVPVDHDALKALAAFPQVGVNDRAHEPEHCLEVQLPFLQVALATFAVVPLLAGWVDDALIAKVIETLWGGPETLIVVSSDLSHFHDHAAARELDTRTAAAIVALRGGELRGEDACGFRPIRGLLTAAAARGLRCRQLDLRNSGDTAGPRDRVVGYGAFAFA